MTEIPLQVITADSNWTNAHTELESAHCASLERHKNMKWMAFKGLRETLIVTTDVNSLENKKISQIFI